VQVDVVDSEFSQMMIEIKESRSFQIVYKIHKRFLASLSKLSFIDNNTVMEVLERILLCCVRFIAICRLKFQQEFDLYNFKDQFHSTSRRVSSDPIKEITEMKKPLVIPNEEVTAIKNDFLNQVGYLFKIMNRFDNQVLLFRLDFNSYFSKLFNE
jgi:hypothetical protein